jgi:hypothetical protein
MARRFPRERWSGARDYQILALRLAAYLLIDQSSSGGAISGQ